MRETIESRYKRPIKIPRPEKIKGQTKMYLQCSLCSSYWKTSTKTEKGVTATLYKIKNELFSSEAFYTHYDCFVRFLKRWAESKKGG